MRDARTRSRAQTALLMLLSATAGVLLLPAGKAKAWKYCTKTKDESNEEEYSGECKKSDEDATACTLSSSGEKPKKCSEYQTKSSCEGKTEGGCEECGKPKKCKWEAQYDPPGSVPSLGKRVQLMAVTGSNSVGLQWAEHIGFGSYRGLNYIAKVHLTTDYRFARVYYAGRVAAFEREGTTWTYLLAENQYGYGDDANVVFSDVDGEGVPHTATLSFPDGRSWVFDFESKQGVKINTLFGYVYRIINRKTRDGYETTLTYGTGDITITDASGHSYVCEFDAEKLITGVSVNGRSWSYSYDGNTVTETNDQTGSTISTTLDSEGRLTAVEEDGGPAGGTSTAYRYYDADGILTRMVRNGIVTDYSETKIGDQHKRVVSTAGRSVTYVAEGNRVVSKILDEGGLNITTSYGYDARGERTSVTDPLEKPWQYAYDSNRRMTSVTDPDGVFVQWVYDGANLVTKTTSDGSWTYEYDSTNRLTRETFPDGGERQHVLYPEQDGQGQPHPWRGLTRYELTKVDPSTWTAVYYEYNDLGLVTLKKGPYFCDPDNPGDNLPEKGVIYAYDSWGNLTDVTDENGNQTHYTYDAADRLKTVTVAYGTPDAMPTEYWYDGLGRKTKEQDATLAYTEWHYDTRGFVTKISGSAASGGGGCTGCGQAAGAAARLGDYYYDDAGLVTKFVDIHPDQRETSHHYDAVGRRTLTVDARFYETAYSYDDAGHLSTVEDANHEVTTHTYTDGERLKTVMNAEQETVTYDYDAEGRQNLVADDAGGSRVTDYDSMGRVEQVDVAVETGVTRTTTYHYDLAGNMTRMVGPGGLVTDHEHDAEGNVTRTTQDPGDLNVITQSFYDDGGRLTKTLDPLEHETVYHYDSANRLTKVVSHLVNATEYGYDAVGRRTSVKVAGRTSTTTYNKAGWVTSVYDGHSTTSYCYDNVGNRTCVTVSGRSPVYYFYDDANNLTRTEQTYDTVTIVTSRVPDGVGNVLSSTDGEQKLTSYVYDGANRVETATNPELETTTYEYDAAGRRTLVSFDNVSSRSYGYNFAGELTSTSGGPEGDLVYEYDGAGRQKIVRDANSRERETFYDILGRVTMVHNEMDQAVIYRYDDAGRRYEFEDAKQNVTVYDYDDDNRLTQMTYPAVAGQPANVETYEHDAGGLLTKKVTLNGDVIAYGYNGAGQLDSVTINQKVISYLRDDAGAVTSIGGDDDVTTIGYVYDGFGRMTSASDSTLEKTISYAYDRRGLRTRMELPGTGGATVAYAYDDAMRLSTVQRTDEASPAAYAYDDGGRRTSLTLPNGVATSYTYDTNDRVDVLSTSKDTTTLASFDYEVDPTGNREGITYADGSVSTYGFDDAYRLTSETRTKAGTTLYEQSFWYDAVGNRTRMTATNVAAYRADAKTATLFHLDEAEESLEVTDSSGHGLTGEALGSVLLGVEGRFGKAAEFDGSSGSEIKVPDDPWLEAGSGEFTLEAWIRPDALALGTDVMAVVSKWCEVTGYEKRSYLLLVNADGKLEGRVWGAGDESATIVSDESLEAALADKEWVHVALERSPSGELSLWVDRVKQASTATLTYALADTDEPFRIGAAGNVQGGQAEDGMYFVGLIDEVRLSREARGAAGKLCSVEIEYFYNARNQLVAENSGTSVKMYSYDNNGNTVGIAETCAGVNGGVLVRTANDDKNVTAAEHLVLNIGSDATVYVCYDPRATTLPSWLGGTWTLTEQEVWTTDLAALPMKVYMKDYPAGDVTLGGNKCGGGEGAGSNYFVVVEAGTAVTIVSVSTGKTYTLGTMKVGEKQYIDREYVIVNIDGAVTVAEVVMTYDELNRMTGYTGPEGTESFGYRGAEWHRFSANGTDFLYDGDDILADITTGIDRVYVTPFLDQNLSMTITAGDQAGTYYYSQDGLGSVRTLTDTTGALKNKYDYLPFGGPFAPGTSVTVEQRYTYTGREASATSPLMYYRYRQYDPRLGRFGARDPAGHRETTGCSLYEYVGGNPLIWVDPYGLKEKRCCPDYIQVKVRRYNPTYPAFVVEYRWRSKEESEECDPKCCRFVVFVRGEHTDEGKPVEKNLVGESERYELKLVTDEERKLSKTEFRQDSPCLGPNGYRKDHPGWQAPARDLKRKVTTELEFIAKIVDISVKGDTYCGKHSAKTVLQVQHKVRAWTFREDDEWKAGHKPSKGKTYKEKAD